MTEPMPTRTVCFQCRAVPDKGTSGVELCQVHAATSELLDVLKGLS